MKPKLQDNLKIIVLKANVSFRGSFNALLRLPEGDAIWIRISEENYKRLKEHETNNTRTSKRK